MPYLVSITSSQDKSAHSFVTEEWDEAIKSVAGLTFEIDSLSITRIYNMQMVGHLGNSKEGINLMETAVRNHYGELQDRKEH